MRTLIFLLFVLLVGGTVQADPVPDPTPPPQAPPGTPLGEGESLPEPPPEFDNPPGLDPGLDPDLHVDPAGPEEFVGQDDGEYDPVEFEEPSAYVDPTTVEEDPAFAEDHPQVVDDRDADPYDADVPVDDPTPPAPDLYHAQESPDSYGDHAAPHADTHPDDPRDTHDSYDPHDAHEAHGDAYAELDEAPESDGGDEPSGPAAPSAPDLKDAPRIIADGFPDLADAVTVTTGRGIVTVEGVVPRLAQVLEIEEALGRLGDNKLVVNNLVVKPPQRPDGEIAAELTAALAANDAIRPHDIRFTVREQQVFLSGWAPDLATVRMAIAEAARIDGVVKVDIAALRAH